MYMAAFNRLDALKATTGAASQEGQANGPTAGQSGLPQCDSQWIETTNAKAQARLEMLSADFKRQKDEGVKVELGIRFTTVWVYSCKMRS